MSLSEELRAEQVGNLDISAFTQVSHTLSVQDTITQMRDNNHDFCLITNEDDKLIGIFTARDFMRKVATQLTLLNAPISEVMSSKLAPVQDDSVAADGFRLLDETGYRNLPVLDGNGRIVGNMSHHSVMDFIAGQYPELIVNHPPRPDRFPAKAEGG
ncbi:MAG: CBS domain-containing protein [Methylococcales bacterium]|nr:CBS domain-containing protein [Methylococcales bacterium]